MNRTVAFVYDVYRDGAKYETLEAVGTPTIRTVASGELKMALSGTFIQNPNVDFLTDTIRPSMILNGETYPLGEFYATTVPISYENGVDHMQVEAYDGCLILKQATLTDMLTLKAGKKYTDIVQNFLTENGIEKAIIENSSATLATDREDWDIGTPALTVINALLKEINYNPLWFDLEGNARVQKYVQPSANTVSISYASGETSIIASDCSSSLDTYSAYNVFIAVVSSPDYELPMRAVSVNDDPASPLSTIRRGRRIVAPVVKLDNIASQEDLQEYVDNLRFKSMASGETITFTTANNPIHGVGEVLSIDHERLSGIYEETEWTMYLSYSGQMEHKAKKVVFV